jgi:hypothetical protein
VLLNADGGKTVDDIVLKIEAYMFRTGAHNVVDDMLDLFGFRIGRVFDPTNQSDQEAASGNDMR